MNITRRLAKSALLFAGALFFWSSWAASPLRFALMNLHPAPLNHELLKNGPPAKRVVKGAPSDQQRFESARKLGDALRNPKAISTGDVRDARDTWGDDAARLLSLIR